MERDQHSPDKEEEQQAKKEQNPLLKYHQVIQQEEEQLAKRRELLRGQKAKKDLGETRFGIAMSGGGIRSATINLGLLRTLNQFRVFEKADYLSTVSGGGYTGAHMQAMLKQTGDYRQLFKEKEISRMRARGEYMTPGTRLEKSWNTLVLVVGYLISTIMSWVAPAIITFLIVAIFAAVGEYYDVDLVTPTNAVIEKWNLLTIGIVALLVIFTFHFFFNLAFNFSLGVSRVFNKMEAGLAFGTLIVLSFWLLFQIISWDINPGAIQTDDFVSRSLRYFASLGLLTKMLLYVFFVLAIIALGFFTDLNALSFHRFYRNQLAEAFLNRKDTGEYYNVPVKDLFNAHSPHKKDYLAPYPLINTCLNLQAVGGGDEKFKGAKASDYFLLSPLFFGSKLTGYLPSSYFKDYEKMTLPAAMTISAAAVNPGMGMYSNKILSVLMTIFNARFGFWISNPLKHNASRIVWWPTYFFNELFSRIGTANKKLNISDGGHIENLGVYELLRRKCRLIIAVDAGADATYSFVDLENMTVRARNELGLEIEFRDGQVPEDIIRPKPSHGYSQKRYAIADIYQIWDEIDSGKIIKDRDYKSFEVIINYNDLKESIKNLDFHGKLLSRMIFGVITQFKASALLEQELGKLQIEDEDLVKEIVKERIFSESLPERKKSILRVLKRALKSEPDQMKTLLKKVRLLNPEYNDEWKLPETFINDIIERHLESKVVEIERALLDLLDGHTLRQTYEVMKNFVSLLNGVRAGIEQKLGLPFLMRKIEDEIIKGVLIEEGLDAQKVTRKLAEEPDDTRLIRWLKEQDLQAKKVEDLIGERNRVRNLLDEPLSERELKHALVNLRFDEMSEQGVITLWKLKNVLTQEWTVSELEDQLAKTFQEEGLPQSFISQFAEIRAIQQQKIETMMDKVSTQIEQQVNRNIKVGVLVYVKSSVRAPLGKIYTNDGLKYAVYKYKIYHPSFPHESTADQFFDPVQWESYYLLGQYLGAEVLGISGLDKYFAGEYTAPDFDIKDLLYRFDFGDGERNLLTYVAPAGVDPKKAEIEVERSVLTKSMPSSDAIDVEAIPSEEELTKKQKIQKKVMVGKQIDYTI